MKIYMNLSDLCGLSGFASVDIEKSLGKNSR